MRVLFWKHGGEDPLAVQTAHDQTIICTQLFESDVKISRPISRFKKKLSAYFHSFKFVFIF